MAKTNGTDAKDIAIYFLDLIEERYTPSMVARTIVQTKSILKSGYTKEEIMKTIEFIVTKTNVEMYSIGYVSSSINSILKQINKEELSETIKEELIKFEEDKETAKEVDVDVGSRERNRNKVTSDESRKREKSYLDLFKE